MTEHQIERELSLYITVAKLAQSARVGWQLGALALAGATIFVAPQSHIVEILAHATALLTVFASILAVSTFRRQIRVSIGRLKFKYKVVRYGAAKVAAAGLFILLLRHLSIGFWHLTDTSAASDISPSKVDRVEVLHALRTRQFELIEQQFQSTQHLAEENVAEEGRVVFAFQTFANTNSDIGPLLDEWEKHSSSSWIPHLAKAEYLVASAWKARGSKWSNETKDQQINRMNKYFAASVSELHQVLSANKRISEAYDLLLQASKGSSQGTDVCKRFAAAALVEVPASFVIRKSLLLCLEPRWGGSVHEMEKVVQESDGMLGRNPNLKILKGFPDYDRGQDAASANDFKNALELYTQAISEGGEYYTFYRDRGFALQRLGRYGESLSDLERADQLEPQNARILVSMAYAYAYLGQQKQALARLNAAAQFDEPSPDGEHLRQQLVNTAD